MGPGRAPKTIELLNASRDILKDIHPASVRAVCYRLFTLGLLSSMAENETNKVSTLLEEARKEELIPWAWIVDETRAIECAAQGNDPTAFMATAQQSSRKDHWNLQPCHMEVWSDKGTVRGTVQPVLDEFGIGYRMMHGYRLATALNGIAATAAAGKSCIIFYLGDYSPRVYYRLISDLPRHMATYGTAHINVQRVAISEADVRQHEVRGPHWELDALSPVILRMRLRNAIVAALDPVQWDRSVQEEAAQHRTPEPALVDRTRF